MNFWLKRTILLNRPGGTAAGRREKLEQADCEPGDRNCQLALCPLRFMNLREGNLLEKRSLRGNADFGARESYQVEPFTMTA
jgi:hypothetical protein